MTINKMIYDLIKREGGYSDHPADKGGATKYGITMKTLSAYLKYTCKKEDIKALTKMKASEIYKRLFFYEPGINKLPTELQPIILDMAVNHGSARAVKFLQNAIAYYTPSIIIDGKIGPQTIEESKDILHKFGEKEFINRLCDIREDFYKMIVAGDETQKEFISGWLNRNNSFRVA